MLNWWTLTPTDRRYGRNAQRVKDQFQRFINERRAETKSSQDDLLQILITDENYKDDDQKIITEMTTFFFAGMKTIMTSTTNLIVYLTRDESLKTKLIEANEKVFATMTDIEKEFTMEVSEEFDVSRQYFYESLRIEPPVPITSCNTQAQDCKIAGVNFRSGDVM